MAILGRFFKLPGHQKFQYKPRYWDPDKEDLERRVKAAEEKNSASVDGMKSRIAEGLRNREQKLFQRKEYSKQVFRSNMMLLVILIILVALTYLLIQVYLPRIVEMME